MKEIMISDNIAEIEEPLKEDLIGLKRSERKPERKEIINHNRKKKPAKVYKTALKKGKMVLIIAAVTLTVFAVKNKGGVADFASNAIETMENLGNSNDYIVEYETRYLNIGSTYKESIETFYEEANNQEYYDKNEYIMEVLNKNPKYTLDMTINGYDEREVTVPIVYTEKELKDSFTQTDLKEYSSAYSDNLELKEYTVKPGDTLSEIALKFGDEVDAIYNRNDNLKKGTLLKDGTVINIRTTPELYEQITNELEETKGRGL